MGRWRRADDLLRFARWDTRGRPLLPFVPASRSLKVSQPANQRNQARFRPRRGGGGLQVLTNAVLTARSERGHNAVRHMTRPVFGIVVSQCSTALAGELHMGVAA